MEYQGEGKSTVTVDEEFGGDDSSRARGREKSAGRTENDRGHQAARSVKTPQSENTPGRDECVRSGKAPDTDARAVLNAPGASDPHDRPQTGRGSFDASASGGNAYMNALGAVNGNRGGMYTGWHVIDGNWCYLETHQGFSSGRIYQDEAGQACGSMKGDGGWMEERAASDKE